MANYTCPMHPKVRQQEPGRCPKCGMELEEEGASSKSAEEMAEPMVMMAHEHYTPYRWVQAANAALGLWLIASPFTLGYTSAAMTWSDVLSGVAVLVLAVFALGPRRGVASWSIAAVGVWLLGAPLLFWAPDPASYANDTLVGSLLIAFAFIIPMGMKMGGPEIPEGWSYNPSAWSQRAPIVALSLVSFFAARYMAAFQLGHIPAAWDPFFGDGTERVLTSDVSRAWPVSDAGLGALTYMIEVLMALMGDQRRWRTMPWMVAGFALIVVPLGIVSIVLIVMQPLAVGAWCTLCLATAAFMLVMIPLALDEVVAMVQFIIRQRRQGVSAWRTFWLGGHAPDELPTWRPTRPDTWRPAGMLWGLTATWSLYAATALGVWLMFSPAVFGSTGAMADSDHLVGALVIVVAVIAMAEVARVGRFLNVLFGLWLLAAPWLLAGGSELARWNTAMVGAAIVLLSLPLGRLRDHYGAFDRWVIWSPRQAARERHSRPWGPAEAPR